MPKLSGAVFLVLTLAFFVGVFSFGKFGRAELKSSQSPCEKFEYRVVRGNSLSGLIESGEEVKILDNFYDCNEVRREDVVAYSYAGNDVPILKIIKAVPGDRIEVVGEDKTARLLINGKIAETTKGEPYHLNDRAVRMLSLYITDYKGVVPKDAYLLLGNLLDGSLDSTVFGLVGRADILGKAERIGL